MTETAEMDERSFIHFGCFFSFAISVKLANQNANYFLK